MKCEDCLGMMDESVEGELEGKLAGEVAAHVAVCASCSQLYGNLRHEQELYGQYLLDVEATPALWANLRLELEKEKVIRASHPLFRLQRWFAIVFGNLHVTPLQAAALVLVTIGLAVGIMVRRTAIDTSTKTARNTVVGGVQSSPEVVSNTHSGSDNTDRRSIANGDGKIKPASAESGERRGALRAKAKSPALERLTVRNNRVPTVYEVARAAEKQYVAAISILSRDMKARQTRLSPDASSQLEKSLAEVDRTISATRQAVREQPSDTVAVQYMTAAYAKKIDLLREITINQVWK